MASIIQGTMGATSVGITSPDTIISAMVIMEHTAEAGLHITDTMDGMGDIHSLTTDVTVIINLASIIQGTMGATSVGITSPDTIISAMVIMEHTAEAGLHITDTMDGMGDIHSLTTDVTVIINLASIIQGTMGATSVGITSPDTIISAMVIMEHTAEAGLHITDTMDGMGDIHSLTTDVTVTINLANIIQGTIDTTSVGITLPNTIISAMDTMNSAVDSGPVITATMADMAAGTSLITEVVVIIASAIMIHGAIGSTLVGAVILDQV